MRSEFVPPAVQALVIAHHDDGLEQRAPVDGGHRQADADRDTAWTGHTDVEELRRRAFRCGQGDEFGIPDDLLALEAPDEAQPRVAVAERVVADVVAAPRGQLGAERREHDMAENIIHLVLARTPTAPEGVKGISLFVVPKFMVNEDGSLGGRNDAYCVSIEHKLGIHASPTAIMAFGDHAGAVGHLVGEENRGLEYMFIMMNAARFGVGLEGVAACERAYQRARDYARDRIQCTDIGVRGGAKVPIIRHPDVRRMLMTMKSRAEATRALAYVVAAAHDAAVHHPDAAERKRNQAFVDLMIPVVKGWSTESGVSMASIGIQVHGGMGYVEETGAAQHLRDAQISTIYEGTTGIQANDLIGRKMAREGGATLQAVIGLMRGVAGELGGRSGDDFVALQRRLSEAIDALANAGEWLVANFGNDVRAASAGAVPFLMLFGVVAGGWQMARAALVAQAKIDAGDADPFYPAKIGTARFYADHVLSQATALASSITDGAAGVLTLPEDMF